MGFVAVTLIVMGMNKEEDTDESSTSVKLSAEEYARNDHYYFWGLISLIAVPFLMAGQNVLNRKMRKLNENTTACYINTVSFIFGSCIMLSLGMDYGRLWTIFTTSTATIVLFIYLGTMNVFQQIIKFKASQNEEASKLAVFSYLNLP